MGRNDAFNGWALMLISSVAWCYYTFWVLVLPIVDRDHPIQSYFPSRFYALLIPQFIMVVTGTLTASFIALVMIRSEDTTSEEEEVAWTDTEPWRGLRSEASR